MNFHSLEDATKKLYRYILIQVLFKKECTCLKGERVPVEKIKNRKKIARVGKKNCTRVVTLKCQEIALFIFIHLCEKLIMYTYIHSTNIVLKLTILYW